MRPGGGDGFNSFGSYDPMIQIGGITDEEGAYNRGVVFEPSAIGNNVALGQILNPAVTAISDAGLSNEILVGGVSSATGYFIINLSDLPGQNSNAAQPWFPGGVAAFNAEAGATYFFEGHLSMSRNAGTTAHTISQAFAGSATLSHINYVAIVTDQNATSSSFSTPQMVETVSGSALVLTTSSANASQFNTILIKGSVTINAAGTFVPCIEYSTAPGGAPTMLANSYFRIFPAGFAAFSGNWI
jgi:hypothetical protein